MGKVCFGRWGGGNPYLIQRSKQRYSNMLWNMRSITRHKRSYGHPLHPDLIPDVLTCVLPLGTVSSGRESEVESAHLFLTKIQFFSACHLTSQHTSTCIHNSIISHSPKGKQEPKNHHQSQHSPNSHALFATDSFELKLAYTAINEHTKTHKRLIFRN